LGLLGWNYQVMKKKLVIENIPLTKTSRDITQMVHPISVTWIYLQQPTGREQLNAYLEVSSEREATNLILKWNGKDWENRVLRVRFLENSDDPIAVELSKAPIREAALARHSVEDLVQAAQAFKVQKKLENERFTMITTSGAARWPVIVLVMFIIVGLGYLLYLYWWSI
jgi:RNA recognition motif-containing protein